MWKFLNISKPESPKRHADDDLQAPTSKWKKYEDKRPPRKFVESWKTGRPWLSYSSTNLKIDQWLTASIKPRGGRRMNYCRSKNVSMISDETVEHVEDEETSTAHTTTNEPEPGLMIDEDDEDEAEDDDIHLLNKYDTDSDYCSDFQAEEFNIERIMCFSKQYDLD
ncbi:hypothetical protein DPMN_091685 [Dreissena polymorpha]|uniref:Uncharacterized protein n=1 Tax=Dreissena polymorpha TaxID=45954 RepID=A0A9D4QZC0_DREPO|nr:hypothetical protein DPMN_091685 [Dreissena polymorpha]